MTNSALENRLLDAARTDVEMLRHAIEDLVSAGGKRARPAFAAVVGDLLGSAPEAVRAIAASSELVHTATLMHDDIIDHSDRRRGRPTANAKYGAGQAVLAGDFLLAKSLTTLTSAGYFAATHELAVAMNELVEAELMQLECAFKLETTLAQTRRIAEGKTGALFAWCARALALTGNLGAERVAEADRLGRLIGYGFQVADDLLDYAKHDTGKPVRKDLREGEINVPAQLARAAHEATAAAIAKAFETKADADYEAAYASVEQAGAVALAKSEIANVRSEVLSQAARLSTDAKALSALAAYYDQHVAR